MTMNVSKEIFVKRFFPYAPITGGQVYEEFMIMVRLDIAHHFEAKIRNKEYDPYTEVLGVKSVIKELQDWPEDENGC